MHIYHTSSNFTDCIKTFCNNNNKIYTFLIDTGSEISLLKATDTSELRANNISFEQCKLTGITSNEIISHLSATLTLNFENELIPHNFKIVDNSFPIKADGILGRDFLHNCSSKIDYETFTITFLINNKNIEIPIITDIPDSITISPRTEAIFPFKINNNEDTIVCNKEISKGVFLAASIIPAKGIKHIKILNTNDKEIEIKNLKIDTVPLANFKILKLNNSIPNSNFHKLRDILNIDTSDSSLRTQILDIIEQFQNIFHFDDERLDVNNFYEPKIIDYQRRQMKLTDK